MSKRLVLLVALVATVSGYVQVKSAEAVPAFARQYDVHCNTAALVPLRAVAGTRKTFAVLFHQQEEGPWSSAPS